MTDNTQPARRRFPWRILGWGGLAVLLSMPLILRFPWTVSDFVFAGIVLGGAGLVIEIIVRASNSLAYRLGGLLALEGDLAAGLGDAVLGQRDVEGCAGREVEVDVDGGSASMRDGGRRDDEGAESGHGVLYL